MFAERASLTSSRVAAPAAWPSRQAISALVGVPVAGEPKMHFAINLCDRGLLARDRCMG